MKKFSFSSYGDFAECFSLRHYGPSVDRDFSPKDTQDTITFQDFVVIQFEHFILPREIKIYETYNPGAVVRILAYLWNDKRWEVLFEEQPTLVEKKSREFCPKLKKIDAMTR
jgi:F-box/leucine-rich repeat protein 4